MPTLMTRRYCILQTIGRVLSQDMTTISRYFQDWRLKLSHRKTATVPFYLNNREAKRELAVYNNNNLLPYCFTPTYLGVKLDRSLMFRHQIESLLKKLKLCIALLRRIADSLSLV